MKQGYFITATGTDQGKTLVTTALCWQLRQCGRKVAALKPVISGGTGDAEQILRSLGMAVTQESIASISPWRFDAALSPDEAARRESRAIDYAELIGYCLQSAEAEITLIEGAGGVMSPLTETKTNLDWMQALGLPVILVSGCYLGCISHLLTAWEALRQRGMTVAGIVLSQVAHTLEAETVLRSLRPHLPADLPVLHLNHLASHSEMWKTAPELTSLLR